MAKIENPIPQRNFELIREQIGSILAEELANQEILTGEEVFSATVWVERFRPFNHTEFPAVNVSLGSGNYKDNDKRQQDGEYTFFIDIYAKSKSSEDQRAYLKSKQDLHRLMGAIEYILSSNEYNLLNFSQNVINKTSVQGFDVASPEGVNDAASVTMARLTFLVDSKEDLILDDPLQIGSTTTNARLEESPQGLYYNWNTDFVPPSYCDILWNGLSEDDITQCIIPRIDWTDDVYFDALTDQQIQDLEERLMTILDIYPQNPTELGDISGTLDINYDNNAWQILTLTGDVTSVSLSNFPVDKNFNMNIFVYQGGTGIYEIDFTGSGLIPKDGETASELQPKTGIGSLTVYGLIRSKNDTLVFKNELNSTPI